MDPAAPCWRPIEPQELPYLSRLGARLAELRHAAGLTRVQLAAGADLGSRQLQRIEQGTRRARRSTIERIAAALGQPTLADELARLAGPALAPESGYRERVDHRRQRSARKRRSARERQRGAEARELLERLARLARS